MNSSYNERVRIKLKRCSNEWFEKHGIQFMLHAACPRGKPQKTVFRGDFSNINYINWIAGIEFHKLQILDVCLLDNCVLYQCWKFDNIRLKPCKDIMPEIFGWSVYLVILRNTALKFSFGLWEPKLALPMGRGVRGRGREVCWKVLQKCFIHRNTHQS